MAENVVERWWSAALAIGFMGGMLVHEAIMEALYRLPGTPPSLALWCGVAEFGLCALIPALFDVAPCLSRPAEQSAEKDCDAEIRVVKSWVLPSVEDIAVRQPPEESAEATSASWTTAAVAAASAVARAWSPFVALSLLVFVGSTASTQSARYVDYTVKVVFKASKLLPTMVGATVLGNSKKFSWLEYAAAILLCVGTAAFSHSEHAGTKTTAAVPHMAFGVACLTISVLTDAFIPNAQQWLMREGVSPNLLMTRSNVIAGVIAFIAVLIFGGIPELGSSVSRVPIILACLAGVGATLSFSVMCQVRLIKQAGSVVAVAVSTIRKSGTMLLSYVLFPGKEFGVVRAVGLAFVAAGLMMAEWQTIAKKLSAHRGGDQSSAEVSAAPREVATLDKAYTQVNTEEQIIGAQVFAIDEDDPTTDEEDYPA